MCQEICPDGWPDNDLGDEYKPYVSRKNELSVLDGCLLWASRVIVPPQGRQSVLEELHESHSGTRKMKALAQSYIWWPGMDTQITDMVKTCHVCQESRLRTPTSVGMAVVTLESHPPGFRWPISQSHVPHHR